MFRGNEITIILDLAFLGLIIGSFVNALVYRIHENAKHKKRLSIWTGRSICPKCKHQLSTLDLIPVISWLLLKGKCRYCKNSISIQYPIVELTTALLFVGSYMFWPFEFNIFGIVNLIYWFIYVVGFITLIIYDIKWMILPDKVVYPLIIIASTQILANIFIFEKGLILATNAMLSVLIASGLFWVLFQVSKGKWIGGGDVKLGIALGLILADPLASLLMLFTASLLGIISIIPTLFQGNFKKNKQIPFGPFLIIATIIVYLYGASTINWYRTTYLII